MIKDSFFKICDDAKHSGKYYVSLYTRTPYYGGPEEGGWWGSDVRLIAYKEYLTEEHANFILNKVNKYADELNKESKRSFSKKCSDEMDWLDARGLESDYLPEVDGEEEHFVVVEENLGSHKSQGCRHYE
jgi:hypothetical protein